LHVKQLTLPKKIENLQSIHITKLICNDPITCAKYYDHKTSCFHTLFNKGPSIFGHVISFLSQNFKIVVMNMTMAFSWIKDAPIYGINNSKIQKKSINTFHRMYNLLPITLQNAQHHQQT
jgi:hypothetical protein